MINTIEQNQPAAAAKWQPSGDQLILLERLKAAVEESESASQFARDYLPFGASKLSKILDVFDDSKKTSYFDEVQDKFAVLTELEQALENAAVARRLAERVTREEIVELKKFRAVSQAVKECMAKRSAERLVKFLAPTGGGKSMLCNYLVKKHSARIVEVREAWRKSQWTVLTDICTAVGVRAGRENKNPNRLEDLLIKSLAQRSMVLAMDEAEFFGSSALNCMKLLLNKTRVVIVLCAIPEAHDRWNQWYATEADQISRRTHAIIEQTVITADDVMDFFGPKSFRDAPAASGYIADRATDFGGFSLVRRIATHLERHAPDKAEADDVKKACVAADRQMRRATMK